MEAVFLLLLCAGVVAFVVFVLWMMVVGWRHDRNVIRPLIRRLHCPECQASYGDVVPDARPPEVLPLVDPAPGYKPPPPPLPTFQVTCLACGLSSLFTEEGELKRTHR
ncbi:hypothetical protein BHS05_10125 [Myxococcus xanthus]|uniref:Uncharacterized protein n=1 Tax=Myxococcus xanthus TaxID=34 RepID=A0AAE6KRJ1_MYXXA|nr:hypothetical protein BHS09_10100 [Myxococcus xanthus]QDE74588.1 hypothetical protein BHS08_10110 [Myxococcus xanthus]QDE96175.1 hypothetical protein BHS05_10125 [Myxococcus xanthus]